MNYIIVLVYSNCPPIDLGEWKVDTDTGIPLRKWPSEEELLQPHPPQFLQPTTKTAKQQNSKTAKQQKQQKQQKLA